MLLLWIDSILPLRNDGWTVERNSSDARPLPIHNSEQFLSQMLEFENRFRATTAETGPGDPIGPDSVAETNLTFRDIHDRKVEGDTFSTLSSVVINIRNHTPTGGMTLTSPPLDVETQLAIEDCILENLSPSTLVVSQTAGSTLRKISDELKQRNAPRELKGFYGRSYIFGAHPDQSLHPQVSQRLQRGYLVIEAETKLDLNSPAQRHQAIAVALNIGRSPDLARQLVLPKPLHLRPVDGVPVRRGTDGVDELFWIVYSSRASRLQDSEVASLVQLAKQQSDLEVPGPITWIVEQTHIFEQLRPAFDHLRPRVSIVQGRYQVIQ